MSQLTPAVPADATFGSTWPFPARYTDAPGYPAHYIDTGEGPETSASAAWRTHLELSFPAPNRQLVATSPGRGG